MKLKRWEKVILAVVFSGLLGFSVLFAAQFGVPTGMGGSLDVKVSPENGYTLLTANTAGFTGSAQDIGFSATKHDCVIVVAGTAPTSVTVSLLMSIDNSTFPTALTHTYTIGTPTTQSFSAWYVRRYVKGYFVSQVGGDTTTTVTLKCVGTK